MQQNYETFFRQVLQEEGTKYEDVKGDNGGPTKCGITIFDIAEWCNIKVPGDIDKLRRASVFPDLVAKVRALDPTTAGVIYKAKYWDKVRGDDLPWGLDMAVVDYAVNSGVGKAISTLGALVDVPGKTVTDEMLAAIKNYPIADLINHFQDARKEFLERIAQAPHNRKFRNGWLAREARIRKLALDLSRNANQEVVVATAPKAIDPDEDAPTPPDSMTQSKTGNSAVAIGGGGTYLSGQSVAQALAMSAQSHPATPGEFVWGVFIAIVSDPIFWVGVGTVGLAAFIWLERRAKLIRFGI
jgi:lysozyme family protein